MVTDPRNAMLVNDIDTDDDDDVHKVSLKNLNLLQLLFLHSQSLDVYFHPLFLLPNKKHYALVTTGWQMKINCRVEIKGTVCLIGEPQQVCAQRL